MVAVDLKTGKIKWYYQYVHHGIWDMDNPCPPILADITVNGRTVKAVAQPTKQAFLYVLNRETGEPIWPIVERPVEKGDVPGEWYSPTQPFPTKPPAYDRQGIRDQRPDRLHAGAARGSGADRVKRYKHRSDVYAGALSKPEGPLATLDAGDGGRRIELAGRIVRSGDAHRVRVLASGGDADRIDSGNRNDRSDIQSGTCAAGGRGRTGEHRPSPATAAQGAMSLAGRAARGRRWADVRGLPLIKPPYGQITRDRSEQGRYPVAGGARRDAG